MAKLGSAWQYLAVLGSAWQRLAVHNTAWQCLAALGNAWQCLAVLACKFSRQRHFQLKDTDPKFPNFGIKMKLMSPMSCLTLWPLALFLKVFSHLLVCVCFGMCVGDPQWSHLQSIAHQIIARSSSCDLAGISSTTWQTTISLQSATINHQSQIIYLQPSVIIHQSL